MNPNSKMENNKKAIEIETYFMKHFIVWTGHSIKSNPEVFFQLHFPVNHTFVPSCQDERTGRM